MENNLQEILDDTTNEELLNLADKARSRLSYYNAAEGKSYWEEKAKKEAAYNYWNAVRLELKKRCLTARPGQYLL